MPPMRRGVGAASIDFDLFRTGDLGFFRAGLVPNDPPRILIALSAGLSFLERAITSLPFTFVKYVIPAGTTLFASFSVSSPPERLGW